jgi:hypothetical protein
MAKKVEKKTSVQQRLLPVGRVINHSLFRKEQFNEKATPSYKIELAFDKGELDDFYNQCLDYANETWGAGAEDSVIIPIKDGDEMAAKRKKDGKPGDAYAGKDVIRANTIYNKDGDDGDGGVQVLNVDVSPIGPANASEIYLGCLGIAAVTFGNYQDQATGNNAITLYLAAFQKTADGDRLVTAKDYSGLFKPVGRVPMAEGDEAG